MKYLISNFPKSFSRMMQVALGFGTVIFGANSRAADPAILDISPSADSVQIEVFIPAGMSHAVLQSRSAVNSGEKLALISGGLDGRAAVVTFTVPNPGEIVFYNVVAGDEPGIPSATYEGVEYFQADYDNGYLALSADEKVGHVLNRLAYGPSAEDKALVEQIGVATYIEQQLAPDSIEESAILLAKENEIFEVFHPGEDTPLVRVGEIWRYFKGTQAPPANWSSRGFDDSGWLSGPSGIGYGDNDDETELEDMRYEYISFFARKSFTVADTADIDQLILSIDFDDSFIAYLNGTEVARENISIANPSFDDPADDNREAGLMIDIDLSAAKGLLVAGENVLAIEVHNVELDSSDSSMIPELNSRRLLGLPPVTRIGDVEDLQHLIHLRGVYSKQQLRAVMAEFWENHFTTDFDKVADYLDDLDNSDGSDAMREAQAEVEAATAEYQEYQFFHENAFGRFGDLLLYSATSPTQLIYLDNVLNLKSGPNENYAREIFELFAFGVDNSYTQQDIEELARCFTGWTVSKVWPDRKQAFPASATNPPTAASVDYADEALVEIGDVWRYAKGTLEPTPTPQGDPTTAWTEIGFNDAAWLSGPTGIGYDDDDDATELDDMRGNYLTLYMRKEFTVNDPQDLGNLLLSVDYDDAFVAYLNGVEIVRSEGLENAGNPPAFDQPAQRYREAEGEFEDFTLAEHAGLLRAAPEVNVLAIQVHNGSLSSSDLSMLPRLVNRSLLPGSIEAGDPNGLWTFRFDPDEHDLGEKRLFVGTPYETTVPAGREGLEGLRDAQDIIEMMANHPATQEFICIKLINRFVSDDITLANYKNGSAPEELVEVLDSAMGTWQATGGSIRAVLETIFDAQSQSNHFWSPRSYLVKAKSPVEFINSSLRALGANVENQELPEFNESMGMHLFTRDEPNGWSEYGYDWIDTGSLLERIKFVQRAAGNDDDDFEWDVQAFLDSNGLVTAEDVVSHFNDFLFQGELSDQTIAVLVEYANTDVDGDPTPLDPARGNYISRIEALVALILSTPDWQFQ